MNLMDTSSAEKIWGLLKLIERLYLVLVWFLGLVTLPLLVSILNGPPIPPDEIQSLLQFSFNLTIYIGIRNRRPWVIPLVLVLASFSSFLMLIKFFTPVNEVNLLIAKGVAGILCLFNVYQMVFFSRKEVRAVFNVNKKIVLG